MSAANNGGPAYPRPHSNDQQRNGVDDFPGNTFWDQEGMSLRDYFAGQALAQIRCEITDTDKAAAWCHKMADSMLKWRSL